MQGQSRKRRASLWELPAHDRRWLSGIIKPGMVSAVGLSGPRTNNRQLQYCLDGPLRKI